MTLEQIKAAFDAAARAGVLKRDANLPALDLLLAKLGPTGAVLPLTAPVVSVNGQVVLAATTSFASGSWSLLLTGRLDPTEPTGVALALDLSSSGQTTSWTLGSLGQLPDSRRTSRDGTGRILTPSILAPLVIECTGFSAASNDDRPLQLRGQLPLGGRQDIQDSNVLAEYRWLFGDSLAISGTVDYTTSPSSPVLALAALAATAAVGIPQVRVSSVGIELTTSYPDPVQAPVRAAPTSAALLFIVVAIPPDFTSTATIRGPLLNGDFVWPLEGSLEPQIDLAQGVAALAAVAGVSDGSTFTLPEGLGGLGAFGLRGVAFGINPPRAGSLGLQYASVEIGAKDPGQDWVPAIPYLSLLRPGTSWTITFDGTQPMVFGSVYGTMAFGGKSLTSLGASSAEPRDPDAADVGPQVDVKLTLPDLIFTAGTPADVNLPLADALAFFGIAGVDPGLSLIDVSILASLPLKQVSAEVTISADPQWVVGSDDVQLSLVNLQLLVDVSQAQTSGFIRADGLLAVGDTNARLWVMVTYADQRWVLEAAMVDKINVVQLVTGLLQLDSVPQWIGDIKIQLADLYVKYTVPQGDTPPYAARGTLEAGLDESLLGVPMSLMLTAEIQRAAGAAKATGKLTGALTVNQLGVKASVEFAALKAYTFEIAYGNVALSAATSWVGTGADLRQILTITMRGTLGELVGYLINLANPNATFRLDPPWNFLDTIDLSGAILEIDAVRKSVSIGYVKTLDLGFVQITKFGLRYDKSSGTPRVQIQLDAKTPGDQTVKPLSWDPATQGPPAVPGQGNGVFDLRYLGLGQHVTPHGITSFTSVTQIVDALVKQMRPATDPTKPLTGSAMQFDAASQWLMGFDATIMDTLSLKLVMHDPDLYGAVVQLSGSAAKSLAGLKAELLYRKISDDLGLFSARLQVPDAFRKLQLGAVSLSLGVVSADVYTDGQFRIDLGFPRNNDFTNSFGIEAGIFNGRGGLYFGLLDGTTSTRVPAIVNGTFDPVIELGIGLTIGLGRSFSAGPLSAGITANIMGVFEGALAWYQPDSAAADVELYHWCRGTVALIGRLSGSVDFSIISASVTIDIVTSATFEIAAYKASQIQLRMRVAVSCTVSTWFFDINFSFALDLNTSFVIGSDGTPPWQLAPGPASPIALGAGSARALGWRADTGPCAEYRLHLGGGLPVFPDHGQKTVHLTVEPMFTVAGPAVAWPGTDPGTPPPEYRVVIMLFTDNDVDAASAAGSDTSFNRLAEATLRWALTALPDAPIGPPTFAKRQDLEELAEQLALPEAASVGFTWANIEAFIAANLGLVLTNEPVGSIPGTRLPGTPFPMLPVLGWSAQGLPRSDDAHRSFRTYQPADHTYLAEAARYFDDLAPQAAVPSTGVEATGTRATESMATHVARDYLQLVMRSTVDAALRLLTSYPHRVTGHESLHDIADAYGEPVTPRSIAVANPDWKLRAHETVRLGRLQVQVPEGSSLAATGETYLVTDLAGWLDRLDQDPTSLRAGAELPLPGLVYHDTHHLDLDQVAAVFWVRLGGNPLEVPLAPWYAEAIWKLNPEHKTSDVAGLLPDPLRVPDGYLQDRPIDWHPLPGDTLADVATYFAVSQNVVAGSDYARWRTAVHQANPTPGPDVLLPRWTTPIRPAETLADLRFRLLLGSDPEQFRALVAPAPVLTPFVTVEVPEAAGVVGAGDTLTSFAQRYGLSVEDLADRIRGQAGLLVPSERDEETTYLAVPDIAGIEITRLLERLVSAGGMSTVSGIVSRFTLHGARLPAPLYDGERYRAAGPMTGIYELAGQQVAGPAPAEDPGVQVALTFSAVEPVSWLTFHDTATSANERLALADERESITVELTSEQLKAAYPTGALDPKFSAPPAAAPTSRPVAEQRPLTQVIRWLTTTSPVLSGEPPSAEPSLWPLPELGDEGDPVPYVLEQRLAAGGPSAPLTEVQSYAWATLLRLSVRRLPGDSDLVEVLGMPAGDQAHLTQLLEHLAVLGPRAAGDPGAPADPPADVPSLSLLWQLPPTPGLVPGLTSFDLDAEQTVIIQTNLSTITRRPRSSQAARASVRAQGAAHEHLATLAEGTAFLKLLWEGAVTGAGGYWLRLVPAQANGADGRLSLDGVAELRLLVQLASQSQTDPDLDRPDRRLHAFNDCAVVGDGLDLATTAVSIRPRGQLRHQASDPAAMLSSAFEATRQPPETRAADQEPSAEDRLTETYNLLGYQLLPTSHRRGSHEGRPIGPQPKPRTDDLGHLHRDVAGPQDWHYQQTLPLARFVTSSLPRRAGAPSMDDDPYAGVGRGAVVELWLQDLFGNVSATHPAGNLPLPVRYTDPLLGVGSWPGTTTRFAVTHAESGAWLSVVAELQSLAYQPTAGEAAAEAAKRAARDDARLRQVYYQLMQPDLRAGIDTTLHRGPGSDTELLPADIEPLRSYVLGCLALLRAVASMEEHTVDPAETRTLDDLLTSHGLSYDNLATANVGQALDRLFASATLDLPDIATFRTGDSVDALAKAAGVKQPLKVLLDADNIALLLTPGLEIDTPNRAAKAPDATLSATDLAAHLRCSVRTLVAANRDRPGLLNPGFVFDCDGYVVGVHPDAPASETTLDLVAQTFYDFYKVTVEVDDMVAQNALLPGMFRPGADLVLTGYIVAVDDTLARNGTGLGPEVLAPLNEKTVDLYPPRTPLVLRTTSVPTPEQTLARFAADIRVAPGTLLRHNGHQELRPASGWHIPGGWSWPADPNVVRVPFTTGPGTSIAAVAQCCGADAAHIIEANLDAPGAVGAGVTVTIRERRFTTPAPLSFEELRAAFDPKPSSAELADAVGRRTDVLAPGTLLLCPPGVLGEPDGTTPGLTPGQAAAPFDLSPAALLAANAGAPGLLVPGARLTTPLGGEETVAAADTVTAVLERFLRAGKATGVEDLVTANAEVAFLRPGARVLLPPAPARVGVAIGAGGEWRFPEPVFPIEVALVLERASELVDPALADTAGRAETRVPVHRPTQDDMEDARSLSAFAKTLQRAVPILRVGTATVERARRTDVWAVVFDEQGVDRVTVAPPVSLPGVDGPQPRTFALRPLANRLVSRDGVPVRDLDTEGRLAGPPRPRGFHDVDLEAWARGFLADLEQVLGPTWLPGAYLLDADALDGLVSAKRHLAAAIATGAGQVLEDGRTATGGPEDGREQQRKDAAEALREELLASLTAGYATGGVLQYDSDVRSAWSPSDASTARLVGTATSRGHGPRAYNATPGKVSLVRGGGHVHAVASIPDGGANAAPPAFVRDPLDYHVTDLEFDVRPGVDDYVRSSWLTFVTPLGHGPDGAVALDLGTPSVPLPLRSSPSLPVLLDHRAVVPRTVESVEGALAWHYECTVQHRASPQDTTYVEVTLNAPPEVPSGAAEPTAPDLFAELAQYFHVASKLREQLTGVRSTTHANLAGAAVPRAALRTFQQLATRVSAAWSLHWRPPPPSLPATALRNERGPQREVWQYAWTLDIDEKGSYRSLNLRLTERPRPGPSAGWGDLAWPGITCVTPDGRRLDLEPLVEGGDTTGSRSYVFPARVEDRVPAGSQLAFELRFPEIRIEQCEKATARTWVTRNERLLGADGPRTAAAFVYRTQPSLPARPVRPFIDVTTPVRVAAWAARPLEQAMELLAGQQARGRTIAVGVDFAYSLVLDDLDALRVRRPVGQTASVAYGPDIEEAIEHRMQAWLDQNAVTRPGDWELSLTVYSTFDPAVPVLRLARLVSAAF